MDDNYISVDGVKGYKYVASNFKLLIRKKLHPKKILFTYFSELAAEKKELKPFTDAEYIYLHKYGDFALIGGCEEFLKSFQSMSSMPAIFLPLGAFVDLDQFHPINVKKKYDICFYAPFTEEGIARKHGDLFLKILECDKSLSGVWIGGYNLQERWLMECTYNEMIKESRVSLLNREKLWNKKEFMEDGYFSKKIQEQIGVFNRYKALISTKRINLVLLRNLSSQEVVKVLNRSKIALILSSSSGCLRSLTEALATDVPVVVCSDLNISKVFVNSEIGIISNRNVNELIKNIHYLIKNRKRYHPRDWFSKNWGLRKCVLKLLNFVDEHKFEFDEIRGLTYLPELILKRGLEWRKNFLNDNITYEYNG